MPTFCPFRSYPALPKSVCWGINMGNKKSEVHEGMHCGKHLIFNVNSDTQTCLHVHLMHHTGTQHTNILTHLPPPCRWLKLDALKLNSILSNTGQFIKCMQHGCVGITGQLSFTFSLALSQWVIIASLVLSEMVINDPLKLHCDPLGFQ